MENSTDSSSFITEINKATSVFTIGPEFIAQW